MSKWQNYREESRIERKSRLLSYNSINEDAVIRNEDLETRQGSISATDSEGDILLEGKASNSDDVNNVTDVLFCDDPCEELGFG